MSKINQKILNVIKTLSLLCNRYLSIKSPLVVAIALMFTTTLHAQQNTVALTPPMGWNSYNSFGSAVHEDEVKANADYVAQHLKQYGWQYVVVDFLWSYDNPPGSTIGNPFQMRLGDGSYIPWLTMDKYGRLTPQPTKFPSAFGGNGFKPLGDYIHSLGLKFGIHVMRGIPRQAVWAKTPVLGTNGITADMVADTSSTCAWMNHMYGLNMTKPGAQEYLNSILALYAEWGVDFIKVDDIARDYNTLEIEGYKKAIDNSGRNIALSLSPGATPRSKADHVSKFGNMWRMADDFWDNWKEILQMMNLAKQWEGIGGPGHWPDCDMIQAGKVSKRGPVGPERYSRLTDDELYTHISFWCLYRSPLFLGGNLPENRPIEEKLFTNDEAIAVDQQGQDPKELYKNDSSLVWVSKATGGGFYIGLFNIGEHPHSITINAAQLGLKGKLKVRDIWKKADVGVFKKEYGQNIPPHGCALLKVNGDLGGL